MNRTLNSAEFYLLIGLALFLALAEAPKNIFLYLFILTWFYRTPVNTILDGLPVGYWAPLISIALLSVISGFFSPGRPIEALLNSIDFISIVCILITLSRTSLSLRQRNVILIACLVGIAVALLEGHLRGGRFPSLKSVGHINQAAIYLAIACSVSLSWVLATRLAIWKVASALTFCLLLYTLIKTDSRNAIYAVMLAAIISLFISLKLRDLRKSLYVATAILASAFVMVIAKPEFVEKQLNYSAVSGSIVDEGRLRIWHGAMLAAPERPILGYGVGMFGVANSAENLKPILGNLKRDFNEGDFFFTDHAHNLSINWLLERGMLAILLLYFWMAVTLRYLAINLTNFEDDDFWRLCGIFSVSTAFFCGLGNTSWHHEHSLLAAILIGLSVSNLFRLPFSRPLARD